MFISYNCNVNINIQKTFLTMFEIKVIVVNEEFIMNKEYNTRLKIEDCIIH